jgi:hypothetical protein
MSMPVHAVRNYDKYNPLPPTELQAELLRILEIRRQAKLDVHRSMCEAILTEDPNYSVTMHCVRHGLSFNDARELKSLLNGR